MTSYTSVVDIPKTYFVDIDGVIFQQKDRYPDYVKIDPKSDLLPGVRDKFLEWEIQGCTIILTTGRAHNFRELTQKQLTEAGIPYHHLIMAVGMGQRVLINNLKPQEPDINTSIAVNLEPDKGFKEISDF